MIVVSIILFILLSISVYFNIKFSLKLLSLEDVLEDCLDVIDEKYSKISEILSRPLFYDSPEIRKVVDDVRDTRDSLHKVAVVLYKNFNEEKEQDNDSTVG